jgi:hypothetical protein
MTGTDVAIKPKPRPLPGGPGSNLPSLKHLICKCQEPLENGGVSRCGVRVGGPVVYLARTQTERMTVCVVCHDLLANHAPCQVCGVAP